VITNGAGCVKSAVKTRWSQTTPHAGKSDEVGAALAAAGAPVEHRTDASGSPDDLLLTIDEIRQLLELGLAAAYELTHRPVSRSGMHFSAVLSLVGRRGDRIYCRCMPRAPGAAACPTRQFLPPAVSLLLTGRPRPVRRRKTTRWAPSLRRHPDTARDAGRVVVELDHGVPGGGAVAGPRPRERAAVSAGGDGQGWLPAWYGWSAPDMGRTTLADRRSDTDQTRCGSRLMTYRAPASSPPRISIGVP
jgi:hypothetical protein